MSAEASPRIFYFMRGKFAFNSSDLHMGINYDSSSSSGKLKMIRNDLYWNT